MSLQTASYVRILEWTKRGHCGPQSKFEVSVVTQDLTFYPLRSPGYGSAGEFSELQAARDWAESVAKATGLEVQEDLAGSFAHRGSCGAV